MSRVEINETTMSNGQDISVNTGASFSAIAPITHDNPFAIYGRALRGIDYSSPDLLTTINEALMHQVMDKMLTLPPDQANALWRASSATLNKLSQIAGSDEALQIVYQGPNLNDEPNIQGYDAANFFLQGLEVARDTRNRKAEVMQRYTSAVLEMAAKEPQRQIRVLSIGSGSSIALQEATAALPPEIQQLIYIRLSDINPLALQKGLALTQRLGLNATVEAVEANFVKIDKYMDGEDFDIFEVAGLNDYLKKKHSVHLQRGVGNHMSKRGFMMLSNVAPTTTRNHRFLHDVVGWPEMIYRNADEMRELAEAAGFQPEKTEVFQTPLGFNNFVIARK